MNMEDRDLKEIIEVVEELEKASEDTPMIFGEPIDGKIRSMTRDLKEEMRQATQAYYNMRLIVNQGTQLRTFEITDPVNHYHVMDVIYREGCKKTPEIMNGFKDGVKHFCDKLGLNVEFTDK